MHRRAERLLPPPSKKGHQVIKVIRKKWGVKTDGPLVVTLSFK